MDKEYKKLRSMLSELAEDFEIEAGYRGVDWDELSDLLIAVYLFGRDKYYDGMMEKIEEDE